MKFFVKSPEPERKPTVTSVFDAAVYVLERRGRMESWKLQKLLYYAQAWHLVWTGYPLFEEEIEAWVNGPAVHAMFAELRQQYWVATLPKGSTANLNPFQRQTLDSVLTHYGNCSVQQLVDRTHAEQPWLQARGT